MIREHLPALQIVVPLIAAPLCILLRRRSLVLPLTIGTGWLCVVISAGLLARVLDNGPISYALGGWEPPWGIEYRVDLLSGFMLLFVSAIGALVLTYAPRSIGREIRREKHYLFLASYLLCLTGLLGICITGDLFNVFVFLEVSSLSAYVLISLGRSRRALTAAFRYLILGTIGATFILIGIGLLYMMTGTLNMADLVERLRPVIGTRTVLVAVAFFSVGIAIKMALFPLHIWLPDAYAHAPSVVTAFLGGTATKVSVYVLIRLVFGVFLPASGRVMTDTRFDTVLMIFALGAIVVASLIAVYQTDLKRMLAYSSIAQVGYMTLGIGLASAVGLTGGIVHMFNHALMKTGLFLATGCIVFRTGSSAIADLRGMGRTMPLTMFAWTLGGLGLIGVPLTAGFVSKWYLIRGALEGGQWVVAVLVLLSSLLAVVYVWRIVEIAYFQAPPEGRKAREAPLAMLIPTWVLIGATILFGVWAPLSVGVASRAARFLLGLEP